MSHVQLPICGVVLRSTGAFQRTPSASRRFCKSLVSAILVEQSSTTPPIEPTFTGNVATTWDALILFEAASAITSSMSANDLMTANEITVAVFSSTRKTLQGFSDGPTG